MASRQIGVGYFQVSDEAKMMVNYVLAGGRLSYGPVTKKFEEEFAKKHEVKYASFMNSGTSALQVALHALKIKYGYKRGDEVIVPALTFVATVNIILQNGLKPVFVDVDPDYFDIDPKKIKEKITPRTRCIIPVHIAGQPAPMSSIMSIAKKYNLQVIEDSCETMLVKHNGQSVGSFGDISCFSTYVAHLLTTGVGGFACTNDPELAVLIHSLMNHGRDGIYLSIDDNKIEDPDRMKEVISKRFKFDHVGYSYRLTEMEAALGLVQLGHLRKDIKRRCNRALTLSYRLRKNQFLNLPKVRLYGQHSWMFYPIICKEGVDREAFINFLENKGIETRYLLPLTNQPVYKGLVKEDDYPVARMLNKQAFYIGCHPGITLDDLKYIVACFREYFR